MLKTNKWKSYVGAAIQNISLKFLNRAKSMKKWNCVPATKLSPSTFTTIKTPPQVASKNFAKILIYLAVYISLNSVIVASKICYESQGIS